MLAARYETQVDALAGQVAPVAQGHRHLQHLLYRFLRGSRAETPQGSLPACAAGDVAHTPDATRIHPITGWPSLFPPPYPHCPWLALWPPYLTWRSNMGLPRFARSTRMGEVLSVRRERWTSMTEYYKTLYPLQCLLAQASQHLWLGAHHDVYRECTCVHHTIHPAPSPPDAGRYTLPSRLRCQSRDCGYRVRRLCTGRYLPAHPRRILLMEQQVWSRRARQSTLRPRVAVIN